MPKPRFITDKKRKSENDLRSLPPAKRTARGARPFRVQVICDTGLEYFRNVILGIRQYSFSSGSIELCDRWIAYAEADLQKMIRLERIDGIIAQVHSRSLERRLLRSGIPCVNISNSLPVQRLPLVTQDDYAVGCMAADHLLACGCTAFGFWGHHDTGYSVQRYEGMRLTLQQRAPGAALHSHGCGAIEAVGAAQVVDEMSRWLKALPKPVGVFTVLDTFGLSLLRAARRAGLRVPQDVAILSAGDDEFWVGYESIPLSSVRLPSWQIGFEAARLVDRLLRVRARNRVPAPAQNIRLPVAEISARQSTDILYTQDDAVQRAIAFLRTHSGEQPVSVPEVVRASGICRSALQTRFRLLLGRSILDEIHRIRLLRIQSLLRTTDMKLTEVAERCHFPDSPRLNVFFKKQTGLTPRAYRESVSTPASASV